MLANETLLCVGVMPSHYIGRSIESSSMTWFLKKGNRGWLRTGIWSPMRRLYTGGEPLWKEISGVCTQATKNVWTISFTWAKLHFLYFSVGDFLHDLIK